MISLFKAKSIDPILAMIKEDDQLDLNVGNMAITPGHTSYKTHLDALPIHSRTPHSNAQHQREREKPYSNLKLSFD